jgi:protein arginine N-methyltransferase 1
MRTHGLTEEDRAYFQDYDALDIHELMLKDSSRTLAYRTAITRNPSSFSGKTVLDLGCGTGILSLFAAEAHATRIYAVDNSAIALLAAQIVRANSLEGTITVFRSPIEELSLPSKVDVIVSEWMGHCLLSESMLESVLFARDAFLAPGGVLFPSEATMTIGGFEESAKLARIFSFWDTIEGFSVKFMREVARGQPVIEVISEGDLVTEACDLVSLDLMTATVSDLEIDRPFSVRFLREAVLGGFAVWFDVHFEGAESSLILSTSPSAPNTHWCQTLFLLRQPLQGRADTELVGRFRMRPNALRHRNQDIEISFVFNGEEFAQSYQMK